MKNFLNKAVIMMLKKSDLLLYIYFDSILLENIEIGKEKN